MSLLRRKPPTKRMVSIRASVIDTICDAGAKFVVAARRITLTRSVVLLALLGLLLVDLELVHSWDVQRVLLRKNVD